MRTPPRNQVSVIILAGGQGRRLGGQDKARLSWRGDSLLQNLLRQLSPDFKQIVVVRARSRSQLFRQPNVIWAHDQHAHKGPVAGLLAGLKRARSPWCLCLPVDCVSPPSNLLHKLANAGPSFATYQGQAYYLHSLLPRNYRHRLQQFHNQGGQAMKNACQTLGLKPQAITTSKNTIWSLNTPQEVRLARRRRLK